MDRKITELDSIENITGEEYVVLASKQDDENYKVKISELADQINEIQVDSELSITSTNPVQNKVITEALMDLDDRIDNLEGTGGGSGSVTGDFDLRVASVETETLAAGKQANVEITDLGTVDNVKSLAFSFAIPRGADGSGSGGSGSDEGYEAFGYRTVFAFKHSASRPSTPTGGSWNAETNEVTYPSGWSASDDLERPVWMSNATFDYNSIVTDWSTPIQISGEDGDGSGSGGDGSDVDKAREFIYKQSVDEAEENKPDTPTNNIYVDDYVPSSEGWSDHPNGVSSEMLCEWVCTRSYDAGTGVWSAWEGPVLWSKYGENGKDGDGVEYIYQLSSLYNRPATPGDIAADNSPTTNFQDREFIPAKASTDEFAWSDNPSDVTADIPYEWVSIRKFNWDTQLWGSFQEPTLWAKYGKDGDEAVGFFKSFVFTRSNEVPSRPEGGSYNSPLPTEPIDDQGNVIWTDGIPSGTEMVWMSSRIFSADGDVPQQDTWSEPSQMTDTADFDVEFSSLATPSAPSGHPNTTAGWSNEADESTIWMATSTCSNGVWSDWQVVKIKGEAGAPGTSINILGSFDSYTALIEALDAGTLPGNNPPVQGDCYVVNGELYVWDGDEFINCGNIKGDPGAGIYNITCKYGVSASDTVKPTQWFESSPATNATDSKYLWKQTYIVFTQVTDEGTDNVTFEEVIGVHGDRGVDGETTEFIFILSNNEDASSILVPTSNDPINVNGERGQWSDDALGPGEDYKYEYVSSHIKYYDSTTDSMVWGPYSAASHWATYSKDGKGIDYIEASYAVYSAISATESALAALTWYSSSPAVTYTNPYLWKRTLVYFTDGTTADAYDYECIGKLGDAGIDGDSVQFAFKLTEDYSAPTAPVTSVEGSNIIGAWTDDPQLLGNYDSNGEWIGTAEGQTIAKTYKYQWVCKRTKDKGSDTWGAWGTVSLWSELYPGTYLHIKYSNDIEAKEFTDNNGEDVGKYIGVLVDYNEGDSADFDDYTWRKFEGNDGFGREYIFQLGNDYDNPPSVPTDNDQSSQYQPDGWSLDPIIPTTDNKYCWACHRDYKDNVWGDWSGNSTDTSKAYLFSMYAESVKGETGSNGPILYPAGYWQSGGGFELTYREDGSVATAPYVYDTEDESYYVLIADDTNTSLRPSAGNTAWMKMDTFNAIYTDILIADYAHVGKAVFWGNYIFSQEGVNPQGGTADYTNFSDSCYTSSSTFDPNWCVNLVTGEQWCSAGSSYFSSDGSGYLASGNIEWNSIGTIDKLLVGNISSNTAPYTEINPSSIKTYIPGSSLFTGHDVNSFYAHGQEGLDREVVVGQNTLHFDGGILVDVTDADVSTGGNVQFVSELPSSDEIDDNTLYVIV